MKTLLLPGVNPKTVAWIKDLALHLGITSEQTHLHSYLFWDNPEQPKSITSEIKNLPEDHFELVLAKSFGSLVLMQVTYEQRLQWDKAVVFGIPLNVLDQTECNRDALSILKSERFHVVQQIDDPLGPATEIIQYNPANLCTIEGNDHQYDQLDLFSKEVSSWIANCNSQ